MPITIQQQLFVSFLGPGDPIKILDNNSNRRYVLIVIDFTAGPSVPILSLESGNMQGTCIANLDGVNNFEARFYKWGELVTREMYLGDFAGGPPGGTFIITEGILL